MFYGPNVLMAFIGAAGVLVLVLSALAIPHYAISDKTEDQSLRARLQRKLDQADLDLKVGEYVRVSLFLSGVLGAAAFVLTGAPLAALLGAFLGFFGYWTFLEDRRDRRRRDYQEALVEVITILQQAFAAFDSLSKALTIVAQHAPAVVRDDFETIAKTTSAGGNLAKTLTAVAEQRRDLIFDQLVEALVAHLQAGGELSPVLATLATSVRQFAAGRRRIATAQERVRWEARIVCLAPFTFIVILRQTAPDLQAPFYASIVGQIAILVVGIMSGLAYYIMNRIGRQATQPIESAGVSL